MDSDNNKSCPKTLTQLLPKLTVFHSNSTWLFWNECDDEQEVNIHLQLQVRLTFWIERHKTENNIWAQIHSLSTSLGTLGGVFLPNCGPIKTNQSWFECHSIVTDHFVPLWPQFKIFFQHDNVKMSSATGFMNMTINEIGEHQWHLQPLELNPIKHLWDVVEPENWSMIMQRRN